MQGNCFIILNYNDFTTTCSLLQKVRKFSCLDHILIVDNCSTDGSFKKLKMQEDPKITVLQTAHNGGYAYGNNYGARYAMKKWEPAVLFFSNPDVEIEENTIMAVESTLAENDAYAVCAPLVSNGYNVWNLPGYWGTLRSLFLVMFTLHKYVIKKRLKRQGNVQEVGVVEGSFFAAKAAPFCKIDGFDERTFLYLEENMLSQKLQRSGYQVVVNPAVFYRHEHSKSIKKEFGTKSNAFLLFYPSYKLYLQEYLKCGYLKCGLFMLLFRIAQWERWIFDFINCHKRNKSCPVSDSIPYF